MNEQSSVRAVITGRVQGVSYRAWTVKTAQKLGIKGWVRNRADGSVEALFTGPPDAVEHMLLACRKGPLLARVDAVEAHTITPEDAVAEAENTFIQRPTA